MIPTMMASVLALASTGSGGGGGGPSESFIGGYYYNVAAYLDANGQADGTSYSTEESRYAHTITYLGDAAVSSGVFTFDGSSDYIEVGTGSSFWTPGSGFTLELRDVKFTSAGGRRVLASSYRADANVFGWILAYTSSGDLVFNSSDSVSAITVASYTWTPLTDGTAYDITVSWDGATVRIYLDDMFVASGAMTEFPNVGKQPLRVGADLDTGGTARDFFAGTIRAVRYTKGFARVVTEGAIALPTLPWDMAQATLTDSHWGSVILLVTAKDDGRIIDESPYDWPVTAQGDSAVASGTEPFADANSITFDGAGDWLAVTDDPLLEFGSGDLTCEVFAKHSTTTTSQYYVTKYDSVTRAFIFGYRGDLSPDRMRVALNAGGGSGSNSTVDSGTFTPSGSFEHLAYTRSGSSHYFWADGAQSGPTGSDSTAIANTGQPLRIGADGAGNYMNGYLSEIRVTKAARYTAGFTAPSAVFPRG